MAIRRADFPLPDRSDPRTAPFFDAATRGELSVPRCDACGAWNWFPPERCTSCGSEHLTWTATSGRGALFSWAVVRRPFLPAFESMVPFVTALVALREDPAVRIVTYVVDVPPEELRPEMPLRATFRDLAFPTVPDRVVTVPMFVPA
jgi:uncharacterized OB-fold protein